MLDPLTGVYVWAQAGGAPVHLDKELGIFLGAEQLSKYLKHWLPRRGI